jgi:hypothetical protein
MADVVMIAILTGFTALCVAYIGWCDRIIGTDDPSTDQRGSVVDSSGDTDVDALADDLTIEQVTA